MGRAIRLLGFAIIFLIALLGSIACSSKPASLSEVAMAKSVDSKTQQPVDKADIFSANTETIYCSVKLSDAPSNTKVKAVWQAADVPGVDKNKVIDETTIQADGTRYLGFNISKQSKQWPAGKYAVDLYLDGTKVATSEFSVASVSGVLNVIMAKTIDQETYEPIEKATVFSPDDKSIHAIVVVGDVEPSTDITAVWTVEDVGGYDPGDEIDEATVEADGNQNIGFSLIRGSSPWPTGLYGVQVYVNDEEVWETTYTVAK